VHQPTYTFKLQGRLQKGRQGQKVEAGGALQLLKPAVALLFLVEIWLCWHGAVKLPGAGG